MGNLIDLDRIGYSGIKRRVYELHDSGMTVRQIAIELGLEFLFVREVISDAWCADKMLFHHLRAQMLADELNSTWDDGDDW